MKYAQRQSELCIYRELFTNSDSVRDNGGTLVGSPTVANGLVCNGTTQYATYPTTGFALNGKTALTFEMWFTPTFACDDATAHYIGDMSTSVGGRCLFLKAANNKLNIYVANQALVAVELATYQAYWEVNKPNHLVVAATSGATAIYLNNNLIGSPANTFSFTAQPATLYIGASNAGASPFAGTIHSFSIYATRWDANEVEDAYNKCTFTEIAFSKAVVHFPCKSIYVNTGDGVMLGTDMDMEAADTSAWTAGNSALLTKETDSGTKVLRVAYNGTNYPYASQVMLVIGKTYRIAGRARGNGAAGIPRVQAGSGGGQWSGTTSNTWQNFDVVVVAASSDSLLFHNNGAGAGYAEFDDLTVQEVDFLTENLGTGADVKVGDSGLYGVTQAQYNGFVFDGANSFLDCGSDVVGTSAGTFVALVQATSLGEGTGGAVFANGKFVFKIYTTNNVYLYSSDGSTTPVSAANAATLGNWATVILTRTAASPSLANFYLNGVFMGASANQSTGNPTAGTSNLIIGNLAGRTNTFNGTIKYPTIWLNTVFTATQVRELHNKLMGMINK